MAATVQGNRVETGVATQEPCRNCTDAYDVGGPHWRPGWGRRVSFGNEPTRQGAAGLGARAGLLSGLRGDQVYRILSFNGSRWVSRPKPLIGQ